MYYGPRTVTNGLILSLDSTDKNSYPGSGTTWTDLSNANYIPSVTLSGDLAYSSFSNNVFNLSGSRNNTASGSYFIGYGNISQTLNYDFTTCGWIKRTTSADATVLEYRGSTVGVRLEFRISDAAMTFNQRETVSPYNTQATSVSVTNSLNVWNYFSLSKSGTNWSFYKDGSLIGTTTFTMTETIGVGYLVSIGISWYDDDYFSNGMIGSVAAISHYNRALSSDEILQNYNATKTRFGR